MKFLILSDLHLEFGVPYTPPRDAVFDAVVLAGDVTPRGDVVAWAASAFGSEVPISVVAGNHEYYYGTFQERRAKFQQDARSHTNIHVLNPGQLLLADGRIRILGCSLWTDFEIAVQTTEGPRIDSGYPWCGCAAPKT
jgi:hypothetical protein